MKELHELIQNLEKYNELEYVARDPLLKDLYLIREKIKQEQLVLIKQ